MSIPLFAKTGIRDHGWRIRGGTIRAHLLAGFGLIALVSAIGISVGSVVVGVPKVGNRCRIGSLLPAFHGAGESGPHRRV